MVSWTEEDAREKWEAEHRERCERDRRDGYYRAALQGVLAARSDRTQTAEDARFNAAMAKRAADAMLALVDGETASPPTPDGLG